MVERSNFSKRMKRLAIGGSSSWTLPQSRDIATIEPSRMSQGQVSASAGRDLESDERGAIWPLFPAEAFPNEREFVAAHYEVPEEDIRSALLFFDKFDVPNQTAIGGVHWCEQVFSKVGILRQSVVQAAGEASEILKEIPYAALDARDRIEPGRWTLARPAIALGIPENRLKARSAIGLTFQNALPVFTREVELEDILEFKIRAKPELISLRAHLDELGSQVARNGIGGFEDSTTLARFKMSLAAHIRKMEESNRSKVWHSFKASFDTPVALGAGAEMLFTGKLDLGTLATGAIGVGIKTIAGLRRKRDLSNPFEYLTSAHLDL